MRSGKVNVIGVLILLALVFGLIFLHTFGPYYWDYIAMGEVVKNTAMTCQERDVAYGEKRLTQELNQHEIPDYLIEDDCKFHRRGDECEVRCAWTVSANWPFTDIAREMSFEVHATRGPHSFKD